MLWRNRAQVNEGPGVTFLSHASGRWDRLCAMFKRRTNAEPRSKKEDSDLEERVRRDLAFLFDQYGATSVQTASDRMAIEVGVPWATWNFMCLQRHMRGRMSRRLVVPGRGTGSLHSRCRHAPLDGSYRRTPDYPRFSIGNIRSEIRRSIYIRHSQHDTKPLVLKLRNRIDRSVRGFDPRATSPATRSRCH